MENSKSNLEAQKIVEKIISDNNVNEIDNLMMDISIEDKENILTSIKKVNMSPLSTPVACG